MQQLYADLCMFVVINKTENVRIKGQNSHFILLPVPEEINRPVLPLLDDRPASLAVALLAPGLQQSVGALQAEKVDPAGCLTRGQNVLAVLPRP